MIIRDPRAAYESLTSEQLRAVKEAFIYDLLYNVKTKEAKLFVNTRVAIISKILKQRNAR